MKMYDKKSRVYKSVGGPMIRETKYMLFSKCVLTTRDFVQPLIETNNSAELEKAAIHTIRNERAMVAFSEMPALPNDAFDNFQRSIYPTRF